MVNILFKNILSLKNFTSLNKKTWKYENNNTLVHYIEHVTDNTLINYNYFSKLKKLIEEANNNLRFLYKNRRYNNIIKTHKQKKENVENIDENDDKILYLVNPRGFCKGVSRAIETVEECLKYFKPPIYVKHKIVHNDIICNNFEKRGVKFIEDLNEVPDNNIVIYSAHGITVEHKELAKKKNLIEIDATCPLVNKLHVYVKLKSKEGYKIILIGQRKHVEIEGILSEAPNVTYIVENETDIDNLNFLENDKLFYLTQTTLSIEDYKIIVEKLKKKYPNITTIPSGSICYATTNRQNALIKVLSKCDFTIVVGSNSSSNAKKLLYCSKIRNIPAVLLNSINEFDENLLTNVKHIALTSAASAPEEETQKFVEVLTKSYNYKLQLFDDIVEKVPKWKLPQNLLNLIEKEK